MRNSTKFFENVLILIQSGISGHNFFLAKESLVLSAIKTTILQPLKQSFEGVFSSCI